jgi:hypothetical protein
MYTPVEIHFSDACWQLLHDDRLPTPLSAELQAVLNISPRLRVVPPDPSPRHVVTMLLLHAHELVTFVENTFDALPSMDPGRQACAECLDDLGDALGRVQKS